MFFFMVSLVHTTHTKELELKALFRLTSFLVLTANKCKKIISRTVHAGISLSTALHLRERIDFLYISN